MDIEPALGALPVGVHVVALAYDESAQDAQAWTEYDDATLSRRGSTTVLVVRAANGSTRDTMLWGLDEPRKKRGALLLLTPFAVVGDIVTFPLQLMAAFIIDC